MTTDTKPTVEQRIAELVDHFQTLAEAQEKRIEALEDEVRNLNFSEQVWTERFRRTAYAAKRLGAVLDPGSWEQTVPPGPVPPEPARREEVADQD